MPIFSFTRDIKEVKFNPHSETKDIYRLNVNEIYSTSVNLYELLAECEKIFPKVRNENRENNANDAVCLVYDLRGQHQLLLQSVESSITLIPDQKNENIGLDYSGKVQPINGIGSRLAIPVWFLLEKERSVFECFSASNLKVEFLPPHISISIIE